MISVTNRKKSFTFIELLIVIAIVGVLATISVPRFKNAFDNFELESFTKDIFYLCRYLQATAVGEGKIYYLDIDKADQAFSASFKDEDSLMRKLGGRFGKVYQAPKGAVVSTDPMDKNGVYFYPDGSTDQVLITIENQKKSKFSIIVKGASGGIQIQ